MLFVLFVFSDVFAETFTVQLAVYPPSSVFTVIVAVPVDTAVITPFDETVAIDSFELVHVIFWFVASVGVIVAVKFSVSPVFIFKLVLSKATPVTNFHVDWLVD